MPNLPNEKHVSSANWVHIAVAVISGAVTIIVAYMPFYFREKEDIKSKNNSLVAKIDSQNTEIQDLNYQLLELRKNRVVPESSPVTAPDPKFQSQQQPNEQTFGDYKIKPLRPFEGNISQGTINFSFEVTNEREDRNVNLYTRNSLLQGEDHITKEGESAQLSNSTIARPRSHTSQIPMVHNQALVANIKFKTENKIDTVHVIRFFIANHKIQYVGKFPIVWY